MINTPVTVPLFTVLLLFFTQSTATTIHSEATYSQEDPIPEMTSLRWQNRLILVKPVQPEHHKQIQRFHREFIAEIEARKVLLFQQIHKNVFKPIATPLAEPLFYKAHYKVPPGEALLIGLDGEVKARSSLTIPELAELLWKIDTMPIRKRELEQR
ncbi:DUF4174 domain-containing protein [Planctobacterium marinum]|uniref:DUF4174 domain-containing protein n=1 Tax=Planctobacterium marinum TaxID=1631968 RepID=A0AA48KSG8_9ALTE|nr:hypothetical protein MACH26_26480 [Planctobacterium marinum]